MKVRVMPEACVIGFVVLMFWWRVEPSKDAAVNISVTGAPLLMLLIYVRVLPVVL